MCQSHRKKMAGDTEFSFLPSELDPVLLIQRARQDRDTELKTLMEWIFQLLRSTWNQWRYYRMEMGYPLERKWD